MEGVLANCYKPGMSAFTNDEVRRARLLQLAAMAGGLEEVAVKVGTHRQYLDHIVKKRKLSKPRADGTQSFASLGDDLARKIELAHKLSPGWLDWPFPEVDFDAYFQLTETQRAVVQGRMIGAIQEAQKHASPAMAAVDKKPAPDSKVAKTIKPAPKHKHAKQDDRETHPHN